MRFPRNAKIFRGQLDAAPFAGVLFILVLFLLLHSKLVFTPGVQINLPQSEADLPGTDLPQTVVSIDRAGRLYFEHQIMAEDALMARLSNSVRQAAGPMMLVIQCDKDARQEISFRIWSRAGQIGFSNIWMAGLGPSPADPKRKAAP